MRVLRFADVCASLVLLGVGCSSGNFDVAAAVTGDSGDDLADGADASGVPDSDRTDTAVAPEEGVELGDDAAVRDSPDAAPAPDTAAAPDTAVAVDTPPSCDALSASSLDVYVDRTAAGASVGTATCPFHSIREATTLGWAPSNGRRTIHVAPGAYTESAAIRLSDHVVLAGAGPLTTQITGGGACTGGVGSCVVEVDGGAEAYGFTANTNGSNGVVTGLSTSPSMAPPLVHHVVVTGSTGATAGILVRSSADLGPQITCRGNAVGVHAIGTGKVRVLAPAPTDTNAFVDNQTDGLNIEGSAVLLFDGGEIARNTVNGIRLAGTTTSVHTIASARIHDNGSAGLTTTGVATASVRNSRFEANRVGMVLARTNAASVDLGYAGNPGRNVFGTKLTATRNRVAGVCVYLSISSTVPAVGNSWSACAPTFASVSSCDAVPTGGYVDVLASPMSVTTQPLDSSSCIVAP